MTDETQIRIYYKDTDTGGVVYYAKYAEFFEIGRTEFLRKKGFTASKLKEVYNLLSPVTELVIEYKRPSIYDDVISVKTTIEKITGIRIYFYYEILNEQQQLLCKGKTINASVDAKTLRPKKFPQEFVKRIEVN